MKIAVVGGGVSGVTAAENLAEDFEVTLFEANKSIGGHADTHTIDVDGKKIAVDTGFIVFNPENYPTFLGLLKKYDVAYKESDMSFAVSNKINGLEYNATSLGKLFCQKVNIFKPKFYRMIKDIFRFYKEAPELLEQQTQISLGDYLTSNNYSQAFIEDHLIPMTCALWSGDSNIIMDFPAQYLVAFMQNHKMMQANDRPVWKTIDGGSRQYLNAIESNAKFKVVTNSRIEEIKRNNAQVEVVSNGISEKFDKVIIASHSDQALSMLENPSEKETEILGAIKYQKNIISLHRDTSLLPYRKKAWASWNVIIDQRTKKQCTVSYYMNLLQSLDTKVPVIVSLNMQDRVNPHKLWKELTYYHPVYNKNTIASQQKRNLIQGHSNTYYCGAYWGWGFHEDGARSGYEAAQALRKDIQQSSRVSEYA